MAYGVTFKPLFSDKSIAAEKLIIVEDNNLISDDNIISEIMNKHLADITRSLNIKHWSEPIEQLQKEDPVGKAIRKYVNHPSIQKIRANIKNRMGFKFHHR